MNTAHTKLLDTHLISGLAAGDESTRRAIVREAEQNNYRFSSIVLGIAKSVPFEYKEKIAPEPASLSAGVRQ
jgi:hypothetical protein